MTGSACRPHGVEPGDVASGTCSALSALGKPLPCGSQVGIGRDVCDSVTVLVPPGHVSYERVGCPQGRTCERWRRGCRNRSGGSGGDNVPLRSPEARARAGCQSLSERRPPLLARLRRGQSGARAARSRSPPPPARVGTHSCGFRPPDVPLFPDLPGPESLRCRVISGAPGGRRGDGGPLGGEPGRRTPDRESVPPRDGGSWVLCCSWVTDSVR